MVSILGLVHALQCIEVLWFLEEKTFLMVVCPEAQRLVCYALKMIDNIVYMSSLPEC